MSFPPGMQDCSRDPLLQARDHCPRLGVPSDAKLLQVHHFPVSARRVGVDARDPTLDLVEFGHQIKEGRDLPRCLAIRLQHVSPAMRPTVRDSKTKVCREPLKLGSAIDHCGAAKRPHLAASHDLEDLPAHLRALGWQHLEVSRLGARQLPHLMLDRAALLDVQKRRQICAQPRAREDVLLDPRHQRREQLRERPLLIPQRLAGDLHPQERGHPRLALDGNVEVELLARRLQRHTEPVAPARDQLLRPFRGHDGTAVGAPALFEFAAANDPLGRYPIDDVYDVVLALPALELVPADATNLVGLIELESLLSERELGLRGRAVAGPGFGLGLCAGLGVVLRSTLALRRSGRRCTLCGLGDETGKIQGNGRGRHAFEREHLAEQVGDPLGETLVLALEEARLLPKERNTGFIADAHARFIGRFATRVRGFSENLAEGAR